MDGIDDTGGDRGSRRDERPARRSGDISTHPRSGDRIVFSEDGNSDAWIATDTTVDVTR